MTGKLTARKIFCASSALLAVAAMGRETHASDQVGAYARPIRVETAGGPSAPTVRISGVIAVADLSTRDYTAPACGYVHYVCPAGKESLCALEWADIAKAAGAGTCVAFGGRYAPGGNGRVRSFSAPAAAPDPYPISMGVIAFDCSKGYHTPKDRLDLTAPCTVSGGGAGGAGGSAGGAGGSAGGSGGAGGSVGGAAGSTGGAGGSAGSPAAGGAGGTSAGGAGGGPVVMADGSGCAIAAQGRARGAAAGFAMMALALGMALAARARRH